MTNNSESQKKREEAASIDDAQYDLLCDHIRHALDEENRVGAKIIATLAKYRQLGGQKNNE